jgi:hypothetical protein
MVRPLSRQSPMDREHVGIEHRNRWHQAPCRATPSCTGTAAAQSQPLWTVLAASGCQQRSANLSCPENSRLACAVGGVEAESHMSPATPSPYFNATSGRQGRHDANTLSFSNATDLDHYRLTLPRAVASSTRCELAGHESIPTGVRNGRVAHLMNGPRRI